jgi:hypothetical protein
MGKKKSQKIINDKPSPSPIPSVFEGDDIELTVGNE